MDSAFERHRSELVARERSGHTAVVEGNQLYVWGGYMSVADDEVFLPNDEIWVYDLEQGVWEVFHMTGEVPPSMSGTCGCSLNGHLYLFGGCDDNGQTNQGRAPAPRAAHASATIGCKGYICGGRVMSPGIDRSSGQVVAYVHSGIRQHLVPVWRSQCRLQTTELWHTACQGKDSDVIVFGGSCDYILLVDTGHCNDALVFQMQPYPLFSFSCKLLSPHEDS
ncbi:hypothetical protein L3Q82_008243 [Scortum barcoo]|uniref:Uncharacterized protein n=1 Tax=Scortum barcoo TaxID=214431 RepID=A0ACB8WH55_9TELE|nr:hypothetical protein L3Q82_008243 [Scortum barcoo]